MKGLSDRLRRLEERLPQPRPSNEPVSAETRVQAYLEWSQWASARDVEPPAGLRVFVQSRLGVER